MNRIPKPTNCQCPPHATALCPACEAYVNQDYVRLQADYTFYGGMLDALQVDPDGPKIGGPDKPEHLPDFDQILDTASLTEPQRSIVTTYFVEGLSFTKIAEVRGVNRGTVNTQYYRAIKKLKKSCQPFYLLVRGYPFFQTQPATQNFLPKL